MEKFRPWSTNGQREINFAISASIPCKGNLAAVQWGIQQQLHRVEGGKTNHVGVLIWEASEPVLGINSYT
ncbi:hypothetical protein AQUCO_02900115v1 [Aquilegia coerulea]|uniref:Uncharacterized protein n=1 Tax=Aquilegia coerulea TaxID=218851 RepID=A0A2G5D3H5_AQUCA|nr:hypothetical protein AQUCO_02900115v1 [Aquilegia coerulea]